MAMPTSGSMAKVIGSSMATAMVALSPGSAPKKSPRSSPDIRMSSVRGSKSWTRFSRTGWIMSRHPNTGKGNADHAREEAADGQRDRGGQPEADGEAAGPPVAEEDHGRGEEQQRREREPDALEQRDIGN